MPRGTPSPYEEEKVYPYTMKTPNGWMHLLQT